MNAAETLTRIHAATVRTVWLRRGTIFVRVLLAIGFIPPGVKKVFGERFTLLGPDTDIGFFFEALHRARFYYEFIGWAQVLAGILLLIPRTATLGALLYFPIIVNIFIITISMGFRGTWVITGLMVLANLYLLAWDYDKLARIFAPGRAESVARERAGREHVR